MIVKRTSRYRVYPSRETENKMLDTLELCRRTYNEMLGTRIETYRQAGVSLSGFSLIAIEDLSIKGMVRHPYLAKHIHDAGWGNFGNVLGYKAESAGSRVDKVNPRGTTQRCSQCGANVPKTLAVRWHMCPVCGLHIGRDLNSAKEMLKRATAGTAGSYADGDRSSPLGAETILEGSLSRKSEATQLAGW